jgi:type I restriction enzyme S subunit
MPEDFPNHWQILPLEDCMDAIIDYRGKTPDKKTSGIPLVTARVVKNGRIETPDEFIAEEDYDDWMRRGLPKTGDVVMTTEAPLGEIAQLDGRKIALAQRLITLRGKQGFLNNTYLKFLMQSEFVQENLRARATGTTVLGIRQSELRKVPLVVPPLSEQLGISQVLGALDDKIELNRRMNETLEALIQSLFKSWFVDAIQSALPKGWRASTIGEEVRVVGGGTPSTTKSEFWERGTYHWATPKDLSNLDSPVLLDTERKITYAGVQQISSGLLPIGTVLLSSRAPIGYLVITEVPVAVNQGFIAMICDGSLSNHYVRLWTKMNKEVIEGRANGTTFMEISKGNFRSLSVIVPPQQVLDAFQKRVEPLHRRVVSNLREIRTLIALRDTLLPKLLSGKIQITT